MQIKSTYTTLRLIKAVMLALLFIPVGVSAQNPFKRFAELFTVPKGYVVTYTNTPPVIDGDINDAAWQQARWSEDFEDIEGNLKPKPALQTNVKMLWGDSCLYIAAKIHDPQVWAKLKVHDEIVFHDNDFEVFINPNNTTHQYFEIECNALNTVFDLFLNKPYRNGGNALISWDVKGLLSAVKVQGSLNNPRDTDTGWTLEIAIPFKAISIGNNVQTPKEGSVWRINFSRVEWDAKVVSGAYEKVKDAGGHVLPEHNWVLSAQGVVNMHYPERWGYLQFTKKPVENANFILPYAEEQKRYLWLIYYQQELWLKAHGNYNPILKPFGLNKKVIVNGQVNRLGLEATKHLFMAMITDQATGITYTINQEGLISHTYKK